MRQRMRTYLSVGGVVTATLLALTSCSSTGDGAGSGDEINTANTADVNLYSAQGQPNETLREQLPEEVLEAGKLVIATDATIGEPFGSYDPDGVTMVGIAPDLAYAIGDSLGVDIELHQVVFANLIPGIKADRYAFSLAPMLHTEEREKEVDFIDYIQGGSAFIIAEGSSMPTDLTPDDVCGLDVGYSAGSVEEIAMEEQTEKCLSDGKEAVNGHAYQTNNEGVLALTSGRLDIFATAAAQAGYIALTDNEQLEISGEPFSGGLSAMAFPKESELLPVIQQTLQTFIEDGTYNEVLSEYGIEYLAIESAESNVGG